MKEELRWTKMENDSTFPSVNEQFDRQDILITSTPNNGTKRKQEPSPVETVAGSRRKVRTSKRKKANPYTRSLSTTQTSENTSVEEEDTGIEKLENRIALRKGIVRSTRVAFEQQTLPKEQRKFQRKNKSSNSSLDSIIEDMSQSQNSTSQQIVSNNQQQQTPANLPPALNNTPIVPTLEGVDLKKMMEEVMEKMLLQHLDPLRSSINQSVSNLANELEMVSNKIDLNEAERKVAQMETNNEIKMLKTEMKEITSTLNTQLDRIEVNARAIQDVNYKFDSVLDRVENLEAHTQLKINKVNRQNDELFSKICKTTIIDAEKRIRIKNHNVNLNNANIKEVDKQIQAELQKLCKTSSRYQIQDCQMKYVRSTNNKFPITEYEVPSKDIRNFLLTLNQSIQQRATNTMQILEVIPDPYFDKHKDLVALGGCFKKRDSHQNQNNSKQFRVQYENDCIVLRIRNGRGNFLLHPTEKPWKPPMDWYDFDRNEWKRRERLPDPDEEERIRKEVEETEKTLYIRIIPDAKGSIVSDTAAIRNVMTNASHNLSKGKISTNRIVGFLQIDFETKEDAMEAYRTHNNATVDGRIYEIQFASQTSRVENITTM